MTNKMIKMTTKTVKKWYYIIKQDCWFNYYKLFYFLVCKKNPKIFFQNF